MLPKQRYLFHYGSAVLVVLTVSARMRAEDFDKITKTTPNATTTVYRIDQPNVQHRVNEYKTITFQPGDAVTVQAGGCCQTGGFGRTWKRYVDPQGPNADRLYYGTIWIPGATAPMVRLQGVILKQQFIPAGTPPTNLFLRLGYIDDNYDDNGYSGRDDGTGDQCKGLGNAFVVITIKKGVIDPGVGAPLDLLWDAVDDNFIPKNPKWFLQKHPRAGDTSGVPDADKEGHGFKVISTGVDLGKPPFSTQSPFTDRPTGFNQLTCDLFGAASGAGFFALNGHLNWMAVTYEGAIRWEAHSVPGSDDDYNFRLIPTVDKAGLVTANKRTNKAGATEFSFGVEFDSDETIDHFHTPWWDAFHKAVDKDFTIDHTGIEIGDGGAAARQLADGHFAIVSGLFGLDVEHSASSEIHPVWALAIQTPVAGKPAEETWPMFVRNWGNEGYCSQDQHYLDLQDNSYTFRLPWRSGATAVSVKQATFQTNNSQAHGPDITIVTGQAVLVRFTLPKPESHAMINGELHLEWVGGTPLPPRAKLPPVSPLKGVKGLPLKGIGVATPGPLDTEKRIRELCANLTSAQRTVYQKEWANLKPASKAVNDKIALKSTSPSAVKTIPISLVPHIHLNAPPHVRSVHDSAREAVDKARYEALRRILGDKIPTPMPADKLPKK